MSMDPMAKLKDLGQDLVKNLGNKALDQANGALDGLSDKLSGVADGSGVGGQALAKAGEEGASGGSAVMGGIKGAASGLKDKVTGGGGGGGGGGDKATKSTNIIENIDVGVPVKVAYNQWTEFGAFPSLMKKVENAEVQDEDTKIKWKAQVFWSHREWESTIIEQTPDERIVWRSSGEKGYVDGAVSFHELGPNLTRILVVLEYYPQGFFERTGNLWRAQGRRARLELKHFRRHVMTRTILDTDEVEGWRGTIRDSEVVESHEDALEREQEEQEARDQEGDEQGDGGEDEDYAGEEEPEGEFDEEEPEDEESEEGPEDEEPEDELDEEEPEDELDEEEPEDEEPEDELDEEEEEPEDEESEEELDEEEEPEGEVDEEEDLDEEEPEEDAEEEEPEEEEKPRSRRRRKSR
jgi:uncharacterized membrane protein